jgi:uracil-DNA glycosylase
MVCCLSKGEDTDDPPDDAVEACKPRLEQFIALAEPRLIVTVGKLAKGWLDPGYKNSVKMLPSTKLTFIDHPAFVLRSNISQKGLLVDRAISNIKMAVEEYFGEQM